MEGLRPEWHFTGRQDARAEDRGLTLAVCPGPEPAAGSHQAPAGIRGETGTVRPLRLGQSPASPLGLNEAPSGVAPFPPRVRHGQGVGEWEEGRGRGLNTSREPDDVRGDGDGRWLS